MLTMMGVRLVTCVTTENASPDSAAMFCHRTNRLRYPRPLFFPYVSDFKRLTASNTTACDNVVVLDDSYTCTSQTTFCLRSPRCSLLYTAAGYG